MENLKKYVTGKNLQIVTLISTAFAIILFIMLTTIGGSNLGGLISSLTTFCYIFYLDFIFVIVVTAGYAFRIFVEKDYHLSTKVLTGINSVACLFGFICFHTIHTIKAGLSGDFGSLLLLGDIESQFTLLRIMLLIQIVAGIAAGYFLFYKKDLPVEQKPSDQQNQEQGKHDSFIDQIKTYYATKKGKRNIYIGGGTIAILLVLILVFNIYESNRHTDIDLTSTCTIKFEGVSGKGYANINCTPDYDHNNEKITSFMRSVSYTIDNNGRLENGKNITLKAHYSEATANSNKIKPIKTTKTFKVKGLEVSYRNFTDIPKKVTDKVEEAAKAYLENDIKNDMYPLFGSESITVDDIALIGVYYKYNTYENRGSTYYLFRAKESFDRDSYIRKDVNYFAVIVANISPSYKLDLSNKSKDINVSSVHIYEDEKTDEKALKQFTHDHNSLETIKTNPGSDVYKEERINK